MAKVLFAIVFIVMLIGGLFSWFYQPLMGVVAVSDLGEKLKVGFIYLGPPGDHGWTYQHDQGRLALESKLGDQVETFYIEGVPEEGSAAEKAIEQLINDGAKLIFTTSFGYMESTLKVAKRHPNVRFEHATGYKRSDNVSTYSSRFYEGRYVIGQIAGQLSKTGKAGYVASFPIPEVMRGINAFLLGAQSVNPDFRLKVIWVDSWFDPDKEAAAAKKLLDQGVDVLTQHTDSTAVIQIAEENKVHSFGQASDMTPFAPDYLLTSIINNWGDYYIQRTSAVLADTWFSTDTFGGMDVNMVVMDGFKNMPEQVKRSAKSTTKAIVNGGLHPFAGPIIKKDATTVVAEGEKLSLEALLGMDWYIQGVDVVGL
jgi:simple sugar transport system substrate-binding protein